MCNPVQFAPVLWLFIDAGVFASSSLETEPYEVFWEKFTLVDPLVGPGMEMAEMHFAQPYEEEYLEGPYEEDAYYEEDAMYNEQALYTEDTATEEETDPVPKKGHLFVFPLFRLSSLDIPEGYPQEPSDYYSEAAPSSRITFVHLLLGICALGALLALCYVCSKCTTIGRVGLSRPADESV